MATFIEEQKPDEKTSYIQEPSESPESESPDIVEEPLTVGRWDRIWPVLACGVGLFSDGYLNNVRSCLLYVHSLLTDIALGCWSSQHPPEKNLPRDVQDLVG